MRGLRVCQNNAVKTGKYLRVDQVKTKYRIVLGVGWPIYFSHSTKRNPDDNVPPVYFFRSRVRFPGWPTGGCRQDG